MTQTYRDTSSRRWLAIGIVLVVAVIAAVLLFAMAGGGDGGSGDGGGLYGAALALPAALRARNRTGS